MDTFVVRVYRSERDSVPDDGCLRGVVEEIATGLEATFHDTQELLSILTRPQHDRPGGSAGRGYPPGDSAVPI